MIKLVVPETEFNLTGIINKFAITKKGRIKSFEIETEQGIYTLKIPSKVHKKYNYKIYPRVKIEVKGKAQICLKTGKIKLKVENLRKISDEPTIKITPEPERLENQKSKNKILICGKSTCWKQGGAEIYEKLNQEIEEKGLKETITLKKTGCMGNCKKAPNLVVLPDKTHYHKIPENQISQLIDSHFLNPTENS